RPLPAVEHARLQLVLLAQVGHGHLVEVVLAEDLGLLLGGEVSAFLLLHAGLLATPLLYQFSGPLRASRGTTPSLSRTNTPAREPRQYPRASEEAHARARDRLERGGAPPGASDGLLGPALRHVHRARHDVVSDGEDAPLEVEGRPREAEDLAAAQAAVDPKQH